MKKAKPPKGPIKDQRVQLAVDAQFITDVETWRTNRAPRRKGRLPSFSEAIRILVMDSIRRDK